MGDTERQQALKETVGDSEQPQEAVGDSEQPQEIVGDSGR